VIKIDEIMHALIEGYGPDFPPLGELLNKTAIQKIYKS